jgi:hypothetical protein
VIGRDSAMCRSAPHWPQAGRSSIRAVWMTSGELRCAAAFGFCSRYARGLSTGTAAARHAIQVRLRCGRLWLPRHAGGILWHGTGQPAATIENHLAGLTLGHLHCRSLLRAGRPQKPTLKRLLGVAGAQAPPVRHIRPADNYTLTSQAGYLEAALAVVSRPLTSRSER